MSKLRVMFHSPAPWCHTGYGQQMSQILPRVAARGGATSCVCINGLEHGILELEGIRYYPRILDVTGLDAVALHGYHFQPDVVLSLTDIWPFDITALRHLAEIGIHWIPIVPIDHEPAPPPVLERLALAREVVTYSPFGHRELARLGIESTLIPHTVDTTVLLPQAKSECRRELGIPDDLLLFGMVGTNTSQPPRKGFQQAMDAFARFHRRHPDSGLYLHTFFEGEKGLAIEDYARSLGIHDAIYEMDDYSKLFLLDQAGMARVYSAFDCLLMPSANEGFGVPIIEAMACGVPVIASDFTAMRDLVDDGVTGFKLRARGKRFTRLLSNVCDPCPDHLYELMEALRDSDRQAMGVSARAFVEESYDLEVVWKRYWEPFLARLEQDAA